MSAACAPSPEDPAQACSRRAVPRPGWEGVFSLGAGKPLRFSLSPSTKFPEDAAPTGTGPQGTRSVCALQTLPGERIRAARFILAFLGSKAEGERPCRSLLCQRPTPLRAAAEAMPRPKQTAELQLGVTPSRATSRPLFRKPPAAAQRLRCPQTQQRTGQTRLGLHMGGSSHVLAGFSLASMPGLPSPHWLHQGTSHFPVTKGTGRSTRRLARTPATNTTCPRPGVCARAQPCRCVPGPTATPPCGDACCQLPGRTQTPGLSQRSSLPQRSSPHAPS